MNPRDNDFDWTDERINALCRAMAGQDSVPDLLAPVMAGQSGVGSWGSALTTWNRARRGRIDGAGAC